MRRVAALLTLLIAGFFWTANSGYQHISFLRDLGSATYTATSSSRGLFDRLSAKWTADEQEVKGASTSETIIPPEPEDKVTHIKTPTYVKAIYMSSWVASAPSIRSKLVELIDTTEINAVVIDVKDNTGVVSWEGRVRDLDEFVAELHRKNIYVIARITAFQDPVYVKKHPEQAVHSKSTGGLWYDHKKVPWVDTGSKDMWNYILSVSKEAYARGFDEINLDYIRFPTDGKLSDMEFPVSGERAKTDKPGIVGDFYRFITGELRKDGIPVSGDLFGIIMVSDVDIKTLGQDMHVALQTFDYISPMVYPSHFYSGTNGIKNPAAHPGEIIFYSMGKGVEIAKAVASSTGESADKYIAKYRPFYQDFDMGATYTAEMVRAQITAGEKLGIHSWMLWDPANKYTPSALKSE